MASAPAVAKATADAEYGILAATERGRRAGCAGDEGPCPRLRRRSSWRC